MLAAEAAFEALTGADGQGAEAPAVLSAFPQKFERSWVYEELHKARNFRPAFSKWGLYGAMLYGGIDPKLFGGRAPWTLHHRHADHECLKPAAEMPKIDYPKPDGVLTFDKLSSVFISNTNHEEDQPVHLTLKDPSVPVAHNLQP